jgi:hypothetical protein
MRKDSIDDLPDLPAAGTAMLDDFYRQMTDGSGRYLHVTKWANHDDVYDITLDGIVVTVSRKRFCTKCSHEIHEP